MKDRIELLRIVAASIATPRCAEVGVFRGAFAKKIVEILNPSEFLLVDPWRKFSAETYSDYEKLEAVDWDGIYQRVSKRFGSRPGVKVMRALSLEAAATVPDGSLDFAYIDANHSYESVLEDLRAWFPKVRAGGFISGHDIDQKQVLQAVSESPLAAYGFKVTEAGGIKSYLARKG